jgi:exodeoxyribonuclease VII small subunit
MSPTDEPKENDLEDILRRIEAEETDIDELAGQLKRATGLLDLCRGKIRKAETEVNQIVADLDAADAGEISEGGEAAEPEVRSGAGEL